MNAKVATGALIETASGYIFIAISLGLVEIDEQRIIVISPTAPLAQAMLGSMEGDTIVFNNQEYEIKKIS